MLLLFLVRDGLHSVFTMNTCYNYHAFLAQITVKILLYAGLFFSWHCDATNGSACNGLEKRIGEQKIEAKSWIGYKKKIISKF
jgi:hypothetical protein